MTSFRSTIAIRRSRKQNSNGYSRISSAFAAIHVEFRKVLDCQATTDDVAVTTLSDFIIKTPGLCGGQPRIAGTRIKVKHVYTWVEQMGMTPAQVVAEYPHLTMAQVHAALVYYWSHRGEIHHDIDNDEKLVAELKVKVVPSKLQERLASPRSDCQPDFGRCHERKKQRAEGCPTALAEASIPRLRISS